MFQLKVWSYGICPFIISRTVKPQLKCKRRFVQCTEKVLWLIERVKSGFQSFVLEISFPLDDAQWQGRPVEVDSNKIKTLIKNGQCSPRQEIADILQISKSIKLLVKMKNMSYILQKKVNGLFGQPNSSQSHQNVRKVGYSNSPSPLLQPHYHPVGLNSVSLLGLWSRGTHLETMFPCCFLCLFC